MPRRRPRIGEHPARRARWRRVPGPHAAGVAGEGRASARIQPGHVGYPSGVTSGEPASHPSAERDGGSPRIARVDSNPDAGSDASAASVIDVVVFYTPEGETAPDWQDRVRGADGSGCQLDVVGRENARAATVPPRSLVASPGPRGVGVRSGYRSGLGWRRARNGPNRHLGRGRRRSPPRHVLRHVDEVHAN